MGNRDREHDCRDRDRRDQHEVADRFRGRPKQHTGIWRDLTIRKRPTEVPWLTGELVRRAEERGIPAPVNTRLVEMIGEIERREREMGWDNLRGLAATP